MMSDQVVADAIAEAVDAHYKAMRELHTATENIYTQINKAVKILQDQCPHPKRSFMNWMGAMAHGRGTKLVCSTCHAELAELFAHRPKFDTHADGTTYVTPRIPPIGECYRKLLGDHLGSLSDDTKDRIETDPALQELRDMMFQPESWIVPE